MIPRCRETSGQYSTALGRILLRAVRTAALSASARLREPPPAWARLARHPPKRRVPALIRSGSVREPWVTGDHIDAPAAGSDRSSVPGFAPGSVPAKEGTGECSHRVHSFLSSRRFRFGAVGASDRLIQADHRAVAAATGLPLFHFQGSVGPGNTRYGPDTHTGLLEIDAGTGIKEGSWEVAACESTRRPAKERRLVVGIMESGDQHPFARFLLGSEASLERLAAIVPRLIVALERAITEGEIGAAKNLHDRLYPSPAWPMRHPVTLRHCASRPVSNSSDTNPVSSLGLPRGRLPKRRRIPFWRRTRMPVSRTERPSPPVSQVAGSERIRRFRSSSAACSAVKTMNADIRRTWRDPRAGLVRSAYSKVSRTHADMSRLPRNSSRPTGGRCRICRQAHHCAEDFQPICVADTMLAVAIVRRTVYCIL